MPREKLNHAPLVETILEVRWRLKEEQGVSIDPNYKLLIGRLYDKVLGTYPYHEPLPSASMPDEMLGYIVQHRFRSKKDEWPLIQIGPGILTLNESINYEWPIFREQGCALIDQLFAIYPDASEKLSITNLELKYIDAIKFDYNDKDILAFITENLGIQMKFPEKFFADPAIKRIPFGLNSFFSFPIEKPVGKLSLHLGTGLVKDEKNLVWETIVQSGNEDVVKMPDGFSEWFEAAHTLTDNMFFKLIEGPLLKRFQ